MISQVLKTNKAATYLTYLTKVYVELAVADVLEVEKSFTNINADEIVDNHEYFE